MVVTGSGYEPVTGSNVFLYSNNDGNNRKWRLSQSGTRWRLQNAANGLYMTLGVNVPVQGANVRQWTSSTNPIQYWNITETGDTVTLDGYTCPVVTLGNYYDGSGTTWMLDVDGAMTSNSTNMEVNLATGAASQKFVLYPVTMLSNQFPVPAKVGWSRSYNSNPYWNQGGHEVTNMKVAWQMPATWTPTSTRKYERRIKWRYMDAVTSTWGAWSSWEQWAEVDPYVRDVYCYDKNQIDASFDRTLYKAREFQIELRCCNATTHGQTVSGTTKVFIDPLPTLVPSGASEDGLLIDVTSDYTPVRYIVNAISLDGKELLSEPAEVQMLGTQGQLVIPWSNLDEFPADDAVATVTYMRGTDLYALLVYPATTTMTFDYGEEPATAPTFTDADGRTLKVEHPDGVLGTWVSNGTGVYGGLGDTVAYPFGGPFDVLVVLENGKVYRTTMYRNVEPAHAFNWDGGSLILECSEAPLVTSRSISAEYEAFSLNQRPWKSVHFTETLASEFSVSGLLYEGLTESKVADITELMRQHHVTYRAPSGEIADVAVTSASYTTHREYTIVEVNLIQESR